MKRIVLASLLALSCLLPAQAKAADEIVVNGSTTVLPIMQKVSEAYMAANPNVQIALSGGGSGNGIKALLDGLANIAMSSRDIKGSEKELAAKKGINPVRTAVAVDALVPVVNPKNPINELSLDQLIESVPPPDGQRLHDAVFRNARRQLLQPRRVEDLPRLARIRPDLCGRKI